MRNALHVWVPILLAVSAGCATIDRPIVENPLVIPFGDFEYVWQQTIEVVDEYFDISSENRTDGRIETYPQVAATLLSPWRGDSVGFKERFEATLQSERRRAIVQVTSAKGGYAIQIEVYKELEDLPHPAFATTGDATFRVEQPMRREQPVAGPLAEIGRAHV